MSATDELWRMLNERGVEYLTDDDERAYDEPARTTWDFVLCGYEMTVTATEFVDVEGKTYLEMDFHHAFTPEQAIAATLGRPTFNANLEQALSFMRIWISDDAHLGESELSAAFEKAEGLRKLDAIESAIAATLGGERATHGTLTAEQVREAIETNSWAETSTIREFNDSSWQAIADELNARAERTCEVESSYLNDFTVKNMCWYEFEMKCGYRFSWDEMEPPKFCPNCGGEVKVVDA